MKELKYIFKEIWDKDPFMYFIIVVNALINGILPFIWVLAPAFVIDNLDKEINYFVPYFIVLFLVTSAMKFLNAYLTGNYRMRMNNIRYHSIRKVISYSMNLSYAEQQDKEYNELIAKAIKAVEAPFFGLGMIILDMPIFIGGLVSLFGFLWIFSQMDLWLIIYIVILTIISAALGYKIVNTFEDFWTKVDHTWEQNQQLNYEMHNPVSKSDIIMYDIFPLVKGYYNSITEFRDYENSLVEKEVLKIDLRAKIVSLIRDIPVFYWLIKNLVDGSLSVSEFYVFFTAIFTFVVTVSRLSDQFAVMMKDIGIFRPFLEIVDNKDYDYKNLDFDKVDLEFKNISFKYPSSDRYILKNINLKLNHGVSLAVVGENGAGKTTFAHILAGLYEPSSGEILLNGKNINDYDIDRKELVSAVFQDTLVLPYSIKENVLMDSDNTLVSDIYKKTGLDNIIESYDKNDEQVLLRLLDDDGIDLSGGQKQRLFLARAINKNTAKILILDEPTAQLDSLAERDLYELYNELTINKSSIFISHRLASTKFCDKVIFLRNGEIIEYGSHDELMDKNGEYKELYELQAQNYREIDDEKYN